MRKITFDYVWQLDLAIELYKNQWLRNNHLDPDLDLAIRATEKGSGYELEVSYNLSLGSYNGSDIGPQDEDERQIDLVHFDHDNSDEDLENLVNEILEKLSHIKVAA